MKLATGLDEEFEFPFQNEPAPEIQSGVVSESKTDERCTNNETESGREEVSLTENPFKKSRSERKKIDLFASAASVTLSVNVTLLFQLPFDSCVHWRMGHIPEDYQRALILVYVTRVFLSLVTLKAKSRPWSKCANYQLFRHQQLKEMKAVTESKILLKNLGVCEVYSKAQPYLCPMYSALYSRISLPHAAGVMLHAKLEAWFMYWYFRVIVDLALLYLTVSMTTAVYSCVIPSGVLNIAFQ